MSKFSEKMIEKYFSKGNYEGLEKIDKRLKPFT